jgi:nitroimidazol reductase NimA-like FMN-containing flavoprotein (pyridoxamine 5'-phosphate oxidase superfamily)
MINQHEAPQLATLDRAECLERLAAGRFGRVVVAMPEGSPVIRPVNYIYDEGSVLIQTRPGSKLFALLHARHATFEIDEVDCESQIGWSVIVTGVVEEVTSPPELRRVRSLGASSWAARSDMCWMRIRAFTATGRRLTDR